MLNILIFFFIVGLENKFYRKIRFYNIIIIDLSFFFSASQKELASDVEADCQLLGGKSQALQEEASLMHHIMSRLRRYQDERLETAGLKWKLPPGGQPICLFSAINNPSKNNRSIIRPNDDSEHKIMIILSVVVL